jgi:hypothetical protein
MWLKLLEFTYNSNVHASTSTTPFILLYGFNPKSPLEFLLPKDFGKDSKYGMKNEAGLFLEKLRVVRENARLVIARAQNEQAKHYNKGRKDVPSFKIGAHMLINPHSLDWKESKGDGTSLAHRWIGPFEVLQKINPKTCQVRLDDRYPGFPVFNYQHMKLYNKSSPDMGKQTKLPELRTEAPAEEYEVEHILGKKFDKSPCTHLWLVRWKNYGAQHDSWQTCRDLRNAPEAICEFDRALRA